MLPDPATKQIVVSDKFSDEGVEIIKMATGGSKQNLDSELSEDIRNDISKHEKKLLSLFLLLFFVSEIKFYYFFLLFQY